MTSNTTIAAIATARGAAGVGIVRLSGTQAWAIAQSIFSKPITPKPGQFVHGWVVDPDTGQSIDDVLLLFFKGPHSFTGEDVVEIQGHGGDYLLNRLLDLCLKHGATAAGPGEFTKRAYLNGKLDLTQAESIMDLIAAQGERLLQLAANNLKSRSLGGYIETLGEALIGIQTPITAATDFPDEVDEPERQPLVIELQTMLTKLRALEQASNQNRLAREGFTVALLGRPNAGKSSLFNALIAQERAIVTDIAGTTRDTITETLHIEGIPITFTDTAGIRDAQDTVESIGVARSWQAAASAQAAIYLYDVSEANGSLPSEDITLIQQLTLAPENILVAGNKCDLRSDDNPLPKTLCVGNASVAHQTVSVKTGDGIQAIRHWITQQVCSADTSDGALAVSLNQRQLACLQGIQQNVTMALETLSDPNLPIDLVTVPLTDALRCLDDLLGRNTTEDVLDEVFSRFCVGK